MYRLKLVIVLLLISVSKLYAIDEDNRFNLVGNVRSIVEEDFKIDEFYGTQNKSMVSYYYFNKDGKITEERETDQVGNVIYGIEYNYVYGKIYSAKIFEGEKRNYVGGKNYIYESDKITVKEKNMTEFIYIDASGIETKREIFYGDVLQTTRVFKYSGNKLSEEQYNDVAGGNNYHYVYSYSGNNISEKKEIDTSGELVHSTKYTYNDKGLLTREVSGYVNSDDISDFTYTYEYDNTGNWKGRKEFLNKKLYSLILRNIKYYE